MHRFTPPGLGFSLFLLDKRVGATAVDEPDALVPCWRTPQPRPHAHADHEINMVVSGSARYVWGKDGCEETTVSVGQIFALPAGISHTIEVDDHVAVRGIWINPEVFCRLRPNENGRGLLSRFVRGDRRLTPRLIGDAGLFRTVQELFEQAQEEYARGDTWRDECLSALARLSAVAMLRLMQAPVVSHADSASHTRVLAVKAWMDRHYLEAVTLADLADRASLSISQFCEVFRALTGGSPKAYLIQRRLNHAATLLSTTDLSVAQVASQAGVGHLPHFTALFKQHTGMPPSAYRKKPIKDPEKPEDNAPTDDA